MDNNEKIIPMIFYVLVCTPSVNTERNINMTSVVFVNGILSVHKPVREDISVILWKCYKK